MEKEYLPRPMLFDIAQPYGTPSTGLEGSKVGHDYVRFVTINSDLRSSTFAPTS
jgi:hypothetical protein